MDNVKKLPLRDFTRYCMSIAQVPSSYLSGLTLEEQLLWLCSFLTNEVIPTVNNNGEAVEELQALYVELKNYVDNYFDNLDIQEEVNTKLEEMAQSGELAELISQYLEAQAVIGFNNCESLSEAVNLANGSFARTYGKTTYNDGYGAFYKIRTRTNADDPDGYNLIELTNTENLVAERVYDLTLYVTPDYFGCVGDGSTDDTENFEKCVDYAKLHNLSIISSKDKTYLITDTIDISNVTMDLQDSKITTTEDIDIFEINEEETFINANIKNIVFDMNFIGNSAIKITKGRRNKFTNINIINTKSYGIIVNAGYENLFNNINIQTTNSTHSTIGIMIETADSIFTNITMTNITTAFYCKNGGNYFDQCHTWVGHSDLVDESTMFLLEPSYTMQMFIDNCYCDTMRNFIKYNNNTYLLLHVSNLMYIFNENIYKQNNEDSYLVYANTDDQTRFFYLNNSDLRGLGYQTGAKSYMTNRTNFFGNQSLNSESGIIYIKEYALTDTSSGLTLTVNSVKKDGQIVNIKAVGSYDSSASSSDITFNLGKLIWELLPKEGITNFACFVGNSRWGDTTAQACYMYIPTRNNVNDPITVRVPHGTGTKYIFINVSYII